MIHRMNSDYMCEISSSHGGEYEAQNLLGCTAVFLAEFRHGSTSQKILSFILITYFLGQH
jgi:hypothetical protein